MNSEESVILKFLADSPKSTFGRKEIARKADSRTAYEQNPRWAEAPLDSLVDQNLIEKDEGGHYQFKQPGHRK